MPRVHFRPRRREKVFGKGHAMPLDRNAKARIMQRAHALLRKTEPGKHYGHLTAKMLDVLRALLWHFHNAHSGLCFPGYEAIAARAGCAPSTVARAIKTLEIYGLLSWVNRIVRIRVTETDPFGRRVEVWKVVRTSNSYCFHDPCPAARNGAIQGVACKSENRPGNPDQESFKPCTAAPPAPLDPRNPLDAALLRLARTIGVIMEAQPA